MKMKKLLASALAAAMVISSMVGTMVTSAATSVGTITAGTVNAVVGETDEITANINIAFPDGVVAPHNIISVALEGYTLTAIDALTVEYAEGSAEGKVAIDADGSNLADGKILLEAPVDAMAPTVKAISFVAVFADADDVDTVAGEYAIVVNGDDMTDVNEADIAIDATNGKLVVAAPHVHEYDDGVVNPQPSCTDEGVKTYTCTCGHSYTEAVSALGHTAGEPVEENRVEAKPGVAGSYDTVVYCTVCKAEMSRTTDEIPALPEEPAGPVVDSTLVFATKPSVVYGTASIEMAFRVANTVLAKYADVKMVIVPQKYDTATLNLVENPTEIVVNKEDMVKAGSTRMQYYFKDLFLYELALDVNYMLRGYDAEGNLVAVSEVFTTSPATWLKENIAASSDAKFKTMATDTLIVCDEVVKSVAVTYPNSDLAAAPSVIEGFDVSAATESISDYNDIDLFTAYDSKFGTASTSTYQVRVSAQTEKVTFVNLRIQDKNKALDWNKLAVKVTYTSKDSAGEHLRQYNYGAADFTWAGRYINVKFDQVGIHDSNKDILFEVTYDGAKIFDYTYSVESYLGANLTTNIGEMNTALMKLGQSFRAYQGL